jgi:periplasmic protein TonB
MKSEMVNSQRWEDIVFENRNKEYGAYLIRKVYSRYVVTAVIVTSLIVIIVLALPTLIKYFGNHEEHSVPVLKTVKYTDLAAPPPIDKNIPPPPKMDIPPPVKTAIKFLPPKITDKEIVEEKMPTMDEMKKTEVSTETTEGTGEVIFDQPVEEVVKETGGGDEVFTIVEQMPEYPGGTEAMMKFIGKNVRYPGQARRMGVEGRVFISFVVDAEGKISDVQAIKGIFPDCDKEAVRVIQMMPSWKPGKQRGRPVKVRFVLPVIFQLG